MLLTARDRQLQKSWKAITNHNNIDIRAILLWLTIAFYDFFSVFHLLLLTLCIKCSFFTVMITKLKVTYCCDACIRK